MYRLIIYLLLISSCFFGNKPQAQNNIIKLWTEKGKIFTKAYSDKLEIGIKDNGIRISEENLPKILNPYEHITTHGTKKEKGAGLGLAICKEFVEKTMEP